MRKVTIIYLLFLIAATAFAQHNALDSDSLRAELKESNFHVGVDLQTKYIWRGMEMITESSAPVVFPIVNYSKEGFYAYFMGGYSINGKYAEVDMGMSYTYKWITFGINDYYYPTTGIPTDQYFNYRKAETGHWLEAALTVAPEQIPLYMTVSNFFYGADKDLEGKQAYSTYAELGGHYNFLRDHSMSLVVGAAFNKSCYNGYEKHFSICNVELKYTYNVSIDEFTLPLGVAYIINPVYDKAFVNLTITMAF